MEGGITNYILGIFRLRYNWDICGVDSEILNLELRESFIVDYVSLQLFRVDIELKYWGAQKHTHFKRFYELLFEVELR